MTDRRQILAARALLEWTRQELADAAEVSMSAMMRLEQGITDSRTSTLNKVVGALVDAGIEFIDDADGAIGVALNPKRLRDGRRR